jgi:hypothetical protein
MTRVLLGTGQFVDLNLYAAQPRQKAITDMEDSHNCAVSVAGRRPRLVSAHLGGTVLTPPRADLRKLTGIYDR